MKNNLFDKYIKEHLGDTRPDVPAYVWENIVAKKDRKKPVGYFTNNMLKMAAAAVFILMSTGGVIYLLSHNNIAKNNPTGATEIHSKKNNNIITNKPNENIVEDDDYEHSQSPSINNEAEQKDESFANNNILQHSKSSTSLFFITPDGYHENNLIKITNSNNETVLNSKYFFNDLINKKYSFNPTLTINQLPNTPFIPCPEAEKNTAGNKKYIEVYAGPDYVFRSLSDDTANSAYLQKRKASVKYLFAYSAGVRYTKVFGSGMSVRTGINYSQINEQFKSENGRVTQNIYIINTNGDTTGSYVQSGTQFKTSTNKYRSIDIPLTVGYEMGNGRLHTNINAGAMVNISSSQKGFMLDNNGNVVDISSNKSSSVYQYKTKAGVSFIAATSVYYKLNESLHVMAEPYLKLSLSPMTKPEISLKEKFHTAGLRVGVRMDL